MAQLISVIKEKKAFCVTYKDGKTFLYLSENTIIMRDEQGNLHVLPGGYLEGTEDELYEDAKDNRFVEYISWDDLQKYVDDNIEDCEDDALGSVEAMLFTIAEAGVSIDDETREYIQRVKEAADKILENNLE